MTSPPAAGTIDDPAGPNRPVRFRLCDAYLPTASELLSAFWGDEVLEGQVVARSRSAEDTEYVVVQLSGMDRMVVVAAEKLLLDP